MQCKILYPLISAVLLSACGGAETNPVVKKPTHSYASVANSPFISTNYKAADALIAQIGDRLNPNQPMIIATMVNIDELASSSTFGRLVSEQVSARFSQAKFSMIEMKFRDYVYMKQDQGELLLTREIKDVAKNYNAQAVIVGTYAMSEDSVYVNLKVIQPNTNIVLAVHDYEFPMDDNIKSMTRPQVRKY